MDEFLKFGAVLIKNLQSKLWNLQAPLVSTSYIGDPKNAYLILFPTIFSVDRICGIQTLLAACISEYVNLILKWVLQEDRPYWWVKENPGMGNITLHQFSITCETGPGSPSGHVMVSAAVWYVIVNRAVQRQSYSVKILVWTLYLLAILCVALSRVFLAAHFPHQCALGFIFGVAIGEVISRIREGGLTSKFFIAISTFTFCSSFALYYVLLAMNLDPDRSVALAIKWCTKAEYIHLDTTPLYCSMRYSGSLFGCGMALFLRHKTYFADHYRLIGRTILTLLGIGVTRFMSSLPLPDSPYLLYISSFVVYCVMLVIIAGTVPRLLDYKRPGSSKQE